MKLHLEGLRRRVVKYYFIMIIITVALFEVLFMFYMKEYYYSMAKSYLEQQVRYTQSSYDSTAMDSTSFQDKINNILEKEGLNQSSGYGESSDNFSVAIEIINKNKEVMLDQYGIKTGEVVNYDDVNKALTSLKNAKNSLVASSDSNSDSNSGSNSNNNGSTTNGNSNGGNSTTGKLPKTGTAGVAGTLISGGVALIGGLGLSRKKK